MKVLKTLAFCAFSLALTSCGGEKKESSIPTADSSAPATETTAPAGDNEYDPRRGLGKYDETNVDVSSFDPAMAAEGKKVADVK